MREKLPIISSDDEELEKINKRKLEQLMKRTQGQSATDGKLVTLTDANFASEISKRDLVVVDFWAAWCGPCRMISPIIEQLAREYAGKITFGKLNVDENPMVSNRFGIQSIPAILVFKGGKQVDGLIGAVPKAHIESKFKPYLGTSKPDSAYR
jgi:thioredoxin 1